MSQESFKIVDQEEAERQERKQLVEKRLAEKEKAKAEKKASDLEIATQIRQIIAEEELIKKERYQPRKPRKKRN